MKSNNDIPRFDLAEQILAGQRKFASIKRKAPKSKDQIPKTTDTKPKTMDKSYLCGQNSLESDVSSFVSDISCDKIISEIVARDIQNIRSGRVPR